MAEKRKRERPKARPGGRYDPNDVARRLEELRAMADVDPKVIGPVIWPRQKQDEATRQWWRRTSMRTKDFSLGEMERVIDYLLPLARRRGETKARRLPGFPFIEIDESERVEFGTHGSARAPLDEGTSPGE